MIIHTRITRLSVLNTAISKCRECPRHTTRTNTAVLPGPVYSSLLIVADEPDTTGKPVGHVFLRSVLRKLHIKPDTVYVSTVLKCYSPKKPKAYDIDACREHLNGELRLVLAPVIMPCGPLARQALLPDSCDGDIGTAFVQYNGTLIIPNYRLGTPEKPAFTRILKNAHKRAGALNDA